MVTYLPPSSVTAGSPFSLTVAAEDSSGRVVSSFDGSLTLTLVAEPQEGLLNGDMNLEAVHGIATFSNLTLDTAGSGYSLAVTGQQLTPATVSAMSVVPAAPASLWSSPNLRQA